MAALHALPSLWLPGLPSPIHQLAEKRRVPEHRQTETAASGPGILGGLPRLPLAGSGTHQRAIRSRLGGTLASPHPGLSRLPLRKMREEVFQVPLARPVYPTGGNMIPTPPIAPMAPMGIMGLRGVMGFMQRLPKDSPIALRGVSAIVPSLQRFPAPSATLRSPFGMLA